MHEAARRHLVAELVDAGRRTAKNAQCARCGRDVIRGEDDDNATMIVSVDPEPLDPAGEMIARLDGRHTFDLLPLRSKGGGAQALWIRHPWHYLSERDHGGTVHAMHRCERKP